jgi:hypothetical protein
MEDYRPMVDVANSVRQQCSNCLCWLRDQVDPNVGACRIKAPSVVTEAKAVQPQTHETAWCREWEERRDNSEFGD